MSPEQASRPRGALCRFLLVALVTALADQGLKYLVVANMALGQSFPVLGSVMSLTRQANPGAVFGIFSSAGVALTVVSAVLVVVLVVWGRMAARHHPELIFPLGLIVGGALGNLADRLARGEVVDYLDFHFWPVFNLADIALTVGVLLTAWRLLWPVHHDGSAHPGGAE